MDVALSRKPLCFIHLMKTAGASTRMFLESQFDHASICQAWNPPDFENKPKEELAKDGLFCGHIMGGQLIKFPPETEYFTIVRNPTIRLQSVYAWFQSMNNDYWKVAKDAIEDRNETAIIPDQDQREANHCFQLAKDLNFEEFVSSEDAVLRVWVNNLTFRQITSRSGVTQRDEEIESGDMDGKCDDATKILEACIVIGTQENLEQALELLCYRRNWPAPPRLPHIHLTGDKEPVGQNAKKIIKSRNRIDYKIYHQALKQHQENYMELADKAGGFERIRQFLNENHREAVFGRLIAKDELELLAENAWPGVGWDLREFNIHDQFWRWIGETGVASFLAKLKPQGRYYLKIFFHHIQVDRCDCIGITCNGIHLDIVNREYENTCFVTGALLEEKHLQDDGRMEIEIDMSTRTDKNNRLAAISRILITSYPISAT